MKKNNFLFSRGFGPTIKWLKVLTEMRKISDVIRH